MVISVIEFKKRFKQVFGPNVWTDFLSFGNNNGLNDIFNSMEEAWDQIIKYKNKYEKISNFYKRHKQFTRFVLISIERKYREESRTITFSAPLKTGNKKYDKEWEVEHIFPQTNFDSTFANDSNYSSHSCIKTIVNNNADEKWNKNHIYNLTLISRKLNGNEDYKIADFEKKKTVMYSSDETYEEKAFYINRIFLNNQATDPSKYSELLLQRKEELEKAFKNIFIKCSPDDSDNPLFFFRDVLGYSESEIQSTFPPTP